MSAVDKSIVGQRPAATAGMHHVALFVPDLDAARFFYVDLLGMQVEWQPDADNLYLSGGTDNVALHRSAAHQANAHPETQRLDHIGFIIDEIDEVDQWYAFLQANKVRMRSEPRTHRDGARSFYCLDPAGTVVQIIYHPPLSRGAKNSD